MLFFNGDFMKFNITQVMVARHKRSPVDEECPMQEATDPRALYRTATKSYTAGSHKATF